MDEVILAQPAHPTREERWQAIKQRSTRGLLTYNAGGVAHLEGDCWAVRASEGGYWRVDLGAETCTCPDFIYRASEMDVNCRHIYAVAIAHATRRRHRPHACNDGWVSLTVEEDGQEHIELVPCRRCSR